MPYKDPERKRQWEREHREERNARRRTSTAEIEPSTVKPPRSDLIMNPRSESASIVATALALTFMVALLFTV